MKLWRKPGKTAKANRLLPACLLTPTFSSNRFDFSPVTGSLSCPCPLSPVTCNLYLWFETAFITPWECCWLPPCSGGWLLLASPLFPWPLPHFSYGFFATLSVPFLPTPA